ncbi:MAG: DUF4231 domain-containing protein [Calditrichaeota bacterium]|nr:DUF4231 domain-containing protein [Calditrichota bacterium]
MSEEPKQVNQPEASSAEKSWTDQKLRAFASMTAEEYINERFNPMRGWYDKKAGSTKNLYLRMRAASVIGGAVVPVLINIHFDFAYFETVIDVITTAISLMVVVFVSLESVFHFREQWKNYRSTEQLLANEYFKFASGEGPYNVKEQREAFLKFVNRIESAIERESASTLNVMTTVTEQKVDKNTN